MKTWIFCHKNNARSLSLVDDGKIRSEVTAADPILILKAYAEMESVTNKLHLCLLSLVIKSRYQS